MEAEAEAEEEGCTCPLSLQLTPRRRRRQTPSTLSSLDATSIVHPTLNLSAEVLHLPRYFHPSVSRHLRHSTSMRSYEPVESCTPRRTGKEKALLMHRRDRKAGSERWPMTPSQTMSESKVRSQRHLAQTKRGGGLVLVLVSVGEEDEEKRSECRSGEVGKFEESSPLSAVASDDDRSPA